LTGKYDDEIHFVLDQHAELDFYSASSLKKQSAGRHIGPLGHIILIPSQPVFAFSHQLFLRTRVDTGIIFFIDSNSCTADHIGGLMVSVLASSVVDRVFQPHQSGQTKDFKTGMCCFSAKHAVLREKKQRLVG
jgi:hypothetical protein